MLFSVVRRPNQRSAFHVPETHFFTRHMEFLKYFGLNENRTLDFKSLKIHIEKIMKVNL